MKKVFALVVVVAILVVGAACGVDQKDYEAVVAERDSAQAEFQSVKSELDTMKSLTLPEGAVQLSPVIPGHGGHWANPAQMPLGPIYLVDGKGEVVAIEYMYTKDMMQEVSIPTPEGPEVFMALQPLPVGVTIDHVDVSFALHGHEGFEVPHWDLHMYVITQADKAAITPEG